MRARPTSCWSWLLSCSDADSGNEDKDDEENTNREGCEETKEEEKNKVSSGSSGSPPAESDLIQQLREVFNVMSEEEDLLIRELFDSENKKLKVQSKDDLIRRVGKNMISAALSKPPPPLIEKDVAVSLAMPGIYVYHAKCLTVQFDLEGTKDWCVVKVGKSDNTLRSRLDVEYNEISRKWRCRETTSMDNDDVVACFSGAAWTGSESNIRTRLGLPLGSSKLESGENSGRKEMEDEYAKDNTDYKIKREANFITVAGWSMFFHPESRKNLVRGSLASTIGPSELILMREEDMLQLRKSFKENPARFLSTFPGTNVDAETGPAWGSIKEISLPATWHDKPVKVEFKQGGLIAPLELKLWDPVAGKANKTKGKAGRKPGKWFQYWMKNVSGSSQEHYDRLTTPQKTKLRQSVELMMTRKDN